jgi:hypothetical protein
VYRQAIRTGTVLRGPGSCFQRFQRRTRDGGYNSWQWGQRQKLRGAGAVFEDGVRYEPAYDGEVPLRFVKRVKDM